MRFISIDLLIQILKEEGLENVYLALERLFYTEPLVFIDSSGKAVFVPYEEEEIHAFLELLNEKVNSEEV